MDSNFRSISDTLSEYVWWHIFNFLSNDDIINCSQVSWYWDSTLNDDYLWQRMYKRLKIVPDPELQFESERAKIVYYNSVVSHWKKVAPVVSVVQRVANKAAQVTCVVMLSSNFFVVGHGGSSLLTVVTRSTGRIYRTLDCQATGVWAICVATNKFGKEIVVSGNSFGVVNMWNPFLGQCLFTFPGHMKLVRCIASHGSTVVTGGRDGFGMVWDVDQLTRRHILQGHTSAIHSVDMDSRVAVTGGYDKLVCVWNLETGSCLLNTTGHQNRIFCVLLLSSWPVQVEFASCGLDGCVGLWIGGKCESMWSLESRPSLVSHLVRLRRSHFPDVLICNSTDYGIKLKYLGVNEDADNGPLQIETEFSHIACVSSMIIFINRFLVLGSSLGHVQVIDLMAGHDEAVQPMVAWRHRCVLDQPIVGLWMSPDLDMLLYQVTNHVNPDSTSERDKELYMAAFPHLQDRQ